jgi:hypothetical protein
LNRAAQNLACLLAFSLSFPAHAADTTSTNTAQLPLPADVKIDFTRDIKPILDDSCIRCHGPEKPRSHFRLTDREAALKGGSDGVDILPGQSGASPLIRYVA